MSRRSLPALLLAACGFVGLVNAPAYAQNDPNPGNLTFVGNVDLTNAYMFRGIRQDDTRVIVQPAAELDIALQSAASGLKSTSLNLGSWNSLHTGNAGLR
ncbi:MAG TPA: TorF family putative porin, partial [Vicinamibacterales bacterium]|nr:TorF family putative porin [Vicinamibacterales bacterium]